MNITKTFMKFKIKKWQKMGLILGDNVTIEKNVSIDPSLPWLVEIGNNVTLAPDVLILSHDGSTKLLLGYSKVGCVKIGSNVFVGAKSIILPNTIIGDNVIIGAGSIVSGHIPNNVVIAGSPAKVICSIGDFKNKHIKNFNEMKHYGKEYKRKMITSDLKEVMKKELLESNGGYID